MDTYNILISSQEIRELATKYGLMFPSSHVHVKYLALRDPEAARHLVAYGDSSELADILRWWEYTPREAAVIRAIATDIPDECLDIAILGAVGHRADTLHALCQAFEKRYKYGIRPLNSELYRECKRHIIRISDATTVKSILPYCSADDVNDALIREFENINNVFDVKYDGFDHRKFAILLEHATSRDALTAALDKAVDIYGEKAVVVKAIRRAIQSL